jgi:hypothetical protein
VRLNRAHIGTISVPIGVPGAPCLPFSIVQDELLRAIPQPNIQSAAIRRADPNKGVSDQYQGIRRLIISR